MALTEQHPTDARAEALAVLERMRRAAIDQDAAAMLGVYAADAVHEFPFTLPGLPSRLEGREAIVEWIAMGWGDFPLKYERYRTIAVLGTDEPGTIVVEQEAIGTSSTTGPFTLPNLMVLTARGGEIVRLRDYVNIPAAMAAMGATP